MELFGVMHCRSYNRVKCVVFLCIIFTLSGVIYLGYFCPGKVCALTNKIYKKPTSVEASRNNNNNQNVETLKTFLDEIPERNEQSDQSSYDQLENEYEKEVLNFFQPSDKLPYTDKEEDENKRPKPNSSSNKNKYSKLVTFDEIFNSSNSGSENEYQFDIDGSDVIVFLHIQKTGGTTFEKHLMFDLGLEKPCQCSKKGLGWKKRCKCFRPNSSTSYWIFSRFSTGWQCGLHADWTELTDCVENAVEKEEGPNPNRRFFYITLLRNPVIRFLSEFLHVQRGATWKSSFHRCGGHRPFPGELPFCYHGRNWEDVTWEEFIGCSSNLAFNRQTRMLADLNLVGCYNSSFLPAEKRDEIMLASAKRNLDRMAFFALCENQIEAQYMFEETFYLNFINNFQQYNETHVTAGFKGFTKQQIEFVKRRNHLDIQLYEYAKKLSEERFNRVKSLDPNFAEHYQSIYQPSVISPELASNKR